MPYIGRDTDKLSNIEVLDNITFDGSSSYTLQKGGSNFTPSSANTLLLSIDGVVQAGNFTVSGSTIDFGTAVAGTSTCDFILHYGIGLITAPSDGTVTTAKLAQDIISGETELAVAPAATDEFLVSDAGTLKRIDASLVGRGKIGQVLQTVNLDRESTTSTSYVAISDMSVTITPAATSSKILVKLHAIFGVGSNYTGLVRLKQLISGGSAVYPYLGATGLTTSNKATVIFGGSNFDTRDYAHCSFAWLDSPSTTSAVTYSLEWLMEGNTGYLNRSGQDIDQLYHAAVPSSITVMEVLA